MIIVKQYPHIYMYSGAQLLSQDCVQTYMYILQLSYLEGRRGICHPPPPEVFEIILQYKSMQFRF